MPEGLSPQEVGKEIAEHAEHSGDDEAHERRDRSSRSPRPCCFRSLP